MDIYDGADWTETDIEDLKSEIEHGRSIEEAAEFLCRAGSIDDIARKAKEMGIKKPAGGDMPAGSRATKGSGPKSR